MGWGKNVKHLEERYKQTGTMPDALKNRPEIEWPLIDYFKAFLNLNSRRQAGFAENPIPAAEIEAYARIHGFSDDIVFFYRAMTEMDQKFLSHQTSKREQLDNKSKGKGRTAPKSPAKRR